MPIIKLSFLRYEVLSCGRFDLPQRYVPLVEKKKLEFRNRLHSVIRGGYSIGQSTIVCVDPCDVHPDAFGTDDIFGRRIADKERFVRLHTKRPQGIGKNQRVRFTPAVFLRNHNLAEVFFDSADVEYLSSGLPVVEVRDQSDVIPYTRLREETRVSQRHFRCAS